MATKTKENSEIELLTEISIKLDYVIALLASQGKERDDQIKILVAQGFSNSIVAKLLGIPKGTVDMIRARKKK